MGEPGFWDDQRVAKKLLREAEGLREELTLWRQIQSRGRSTLELLELAQDESDQRLLEDISGEAAELDRDYAKARRELLFGGEYDQRNALLTISAGAGGTEATDWAEMLLRMYLRWAEREGFAADIDSVSPGEEAGIKSVTFEVNGPYAYGKLKGEAGVHRLVRLSPFNSDNLRQTSFALVEVLPQIDQQQAAIQVSDKLRSKRFSRIGTGREGSNDEG